MLGNDLDSSMAEATGVSTSSRFAQRRGQSVSPPAPTALQDSLPRSPLDRTHRTGLAALRFNPHSPVWAAYCKSPYRERSGSGTPALLRLSLPERSRYSSNDFPLLISAKGAFSEWPTIRSERCRTVQSIARYASAFGPNSPACFDLFAAAIASRSPNWRLFGFVTNRPPARGICKSPFPFRKLSARP